LNLELLSPGVINSTWLYKKDDTTLLLLKTTQSRLELSHEKRLALLDRLELKGLQPLIRTSRRSMFEQISSLPNAGQQLERLLSSHVEDGEETSYLEGELFCFEDYALFLIFDDIGRGTKLVRAGIVYTSDRTDSGRRLEVFSRNIQDALESTVNGEPSIIEGYFPGWTQIEDHEADKSDDSSVAALKASQIDYPTERIRSLGLLEDPALRRFLQHICEAYADGRIVELLSRTGAETTTGPLVRSLAEANLVRREVLVSCRKRNRPLFRLPSSEALGQITSSDAVCSECGAKLADERFDELIIPRPAASVLLNDGSWLDSRVRNVLQHLGVPKSTVQTAAPGEFPFRELVVDLAGELFLLCIFDGDVTLADTRTIHSRLSGSNARNLVIVSTGRIHEDARIRLHDHCRQRAVHRIPVNLTLVEGIDDLSSNLEILFEEASKRAVIRTLFPLDRSLGFSAGRLLAARFNLGEQDSPVASGGAVPQVVETVGAGFDHF